MNEKPHRPAAALQPAIPTGRPEVPRDWRAPVLFGALVLLIIATGGVSFSSQSSEAVHRAMVARDLLDGLSRGRQGLVGSLSLAPLPTVVLSLASVVPYVSPTAFTSAVVAGISALLLCLYADRLWSEEGISPWLRWPAWASSLWRPFST